MTHRRMEVLKEESVHQREMFQELDEREELKTTEALEIVQRKHKLIKWERGRESKDFAKVGGVKSNRSVVRSSRQFLLWFVLIIPGFRHRRSNVGFLSDGKRCR